MKKKVQMKKMAGVFWHWQYWELVFSRRETCMRLQISAGRRSGGCSS